MDFASLGMFILDDIYYPIPRTPATNIIGGAGSWAILGARIVKGTGRGLGWTVHTGSDFPEESRKEIESWSTECNFVNTPYRVTTRGLNVYRQHERREFEYASPDKIRIDSNNMTQAQLGAKVFHLICHPLRCISLVTGILQKRRLLPSAVRLYEPLFVWEPIPDTYTQDNVRAFMKASTLVDVMSPNLEELEALWGMKLTRDSGFPNIEILEEQSHLMLFNGGIRTKVVVVRMGAFGARVIQKDCSIHIDAYHQPFSAMKTTEERAAWENKVNDPTGAGNAFLGGFCIGYLDDSISVTDNVFERGAIYGSVAASFAVEQVGTPILTSSPVEGPENWNGESVRDRLNSYHELSDIRHLFGNDAERAAMLGWIDRRGFNLTTKLKAVGPGRRY